MKVHALQLTRILPSPAEKWRSSPQARRRRERMVLKLEQGLARRFSRCPAWILRKVAAWRADRWLEEETRRRFPDWIV